MRLAFLPVLLLLIGCVPDTDAPPKHAKTPHPVIAVEFDTDAFMHPTIGGEVDTDAFMHPVIDVPDLDMGETFRACDKYDLIFIAAAKRWSPWEMKQDGARWLKVQAFRESSCRPSVCSDKDACGIMQTVVGTAEDLGIRDRMDPVQSIEGGARYMHWLFGLTEADGRDTIDRYHHSLDGYVGGRKRTLDRIRETGCLNWAPCLRHYTPGEIAGYVESISALAGHPVDE